MEWAQIIVQVLSAVGTFVLEAVKSGNVAAALEKPLSEILPHELRTTIAKRAADDAAAKKFGG
jgi:hypothetical protein